MSVYVDPLFTMESRNPQAFRVGARNDHRWCHLFADTEEELRVLAEKIGMRRSWFQLSRRDLGHYDLTPGRRAAAIRAGAVEVTREQAVEIWDRTRAQRRD